MPLTSCTSSCLSCSAGFLGCSTCPPSLACWTCQPLHSPLHLQHLNRREGWSLSVISLMWASHCVWNTQKYTGTNKLSSFLSDDQVSSSPKNYLSSLNSHNPTQKSYNNSDRKGYLGITCSFTQSKASSETTSESFVWASSGCLQPLQPLRLKRPSQPLQALAAVPGLVYLLWEEFFHGYEIFTRCSGKVLRE